MPWSLNIHHIGLETLGDATLIVARNEEPGQPTQTRSVLVDGGGGGEAANIIDKYLQDIGIEQLDVIVVTHYDQDHIRGMISLLKRAVPRYRNAILYDQGEPPDTDKEEKIVSEYLHAVREAASPLPNPSMKGVLHATKLVNGFAISRYKRNGEAIIPYPEDKRYGREYLQPHWLLGKDVMWGNGNDAQEGRAAWGATVPPGAPTMVCIAANKYVLQADGKTIHLLSNVVVNDGKDRLQDALIDEYENVQKKRSRNQKSLGFIVRFNNFRYFLAGDLETPQEDGCENPSTGVFQPGVRQSLNKDDTLLGRVLAIKASHHGSNDSTSRVFVRQLRPSAVFISVGQKNTHGHPGQAVVNILDGYDRQPINSDTQNADRHPPPPPVSPGRLTPNYLTGYRSFEAGSLLTLGGDSSTTAGNPLINVPAHIRLTVNESQSKQLPEGQIYRGILAAASAVNNSIKPPPIDKSKLTRIADVGATYGTVAAVALVVGGTIEMAVGALDAAAFVGSDIDKKSVIADAIKASATDWKVAAQAAEKLLATDATGGSRAARAGAGVAEAVGAAVTGGTVDSIKDAAEGGGAAPDAAKAAGLAAHTAYSFSKNGAADAGYAAASAIGAVRAGASEAQAAVIAAVIGAVHRADDYHEGKHVAQLTTRVAMLAGLTNGLSAAAGAVAAAAYGEGEPSQVTAATQAALEEAGIADSAAAGKAAGKAATVPNPTQFEVHFKKASKDAKGKDIAIENPDPQHLL